MREIRRVRGREKCREKGRKKDEMETEGERKTGRRREEWRVVEVESMLIKILISASSVIRPDRRNVNSFGPV